MENMGEGKNPTNKHSKQIQKRKVKNQTSQPGGDLTSFGRTHTP